MSAMRMRGVVEQALVDVADLLDVERAERQPHARAVLAALVERLQRVEQVQHRAVVDRQRLGRRRAPVGAGRAAFEEREAVGVEQAAAVGGQAQRVVLDAAVHGAEEREQAVPGGGGRLQRVLAVAVGALLELRAERGRRERLGVERVVERQQPALLGDEQEDQAHHHRDRASVDLLVGEVAEQLAVAVAVLAVERGDQQLDGAPDLGAELVGDLLLASALSCSSAARPSSTGRPKKRRAPSSVGERAQRDRLLQPELGAPGAGARSSRPGAPTPASSGRRR